MKTTRALLAATLFASAPSFAAPAPPEKVDLFEAGTAGFALYRIPGIVVTPKGTVLAYCEARRSDKGDWGPIDIVMRRSTDGGKTWSPPRTIVHVDGDLPINPVAAAQKLDKPGDNTANNPVAIVDRETGAVHFLYCLEYMRCFSMRSDDDGLTWTKPVEITAAFDAFRRDYDWKVLATGPAHGIQLERGPHKGRLVVPVWLSLGTGGHAHRPSVVATIISDDHGATWRRGDIAVPDVPPFRWPNETVAVQLADGRVMLNARSESDAHRRIVVTGPDGATGWSAPRFDDALVDPICMGALARVSLAADGGRDRIAFSSPDNLGRRDGKEAPGKSRDRVNLTVRMSEDEGATWPFARRIEDGFSGYSDLAVAKDGRILCFYERGSTDGTNIYKTGRLTVARIDPEWLAAGRPAPLPVADLSVDTKRRTVIAQGTSETYQGHPTTVLLPDGKTMLCVWTIGHGGTCGPMKRSTDGGRTWGEPVKMPESWARARNCPAIYRLADPQGRARLLVYAGQGEDGAMAVAHSDDDGATWSDMKSTGLVCVMPLCTIEPVAGGKRLLGMTNIRRPGETKEKRSNVVVQSFSDDGGFTWSPWRIVLDMPGLAVCEPEIVRSPDGRQLLCLIRENYEMQAQFMTSDDEGSTWSAPRRLPEGLVGDRHKARFAPDGRLVVCFRDKTRAFGTHGHFVAWVGRYEDIVAGRDGQCRVKLLYSHAGSDCGYPGLELLPDGTFVATTYIKLNPGPEKQSVASVRFTLDEIDRKLPPRR